MRIPHSTVSRSWQLMRDLLGIANDQDWILEQLALGGQAALFVVYRPDQRPVWQSHERLVLKVYDPSANGVDGAARDEYQSLLLLHELLHGSDIQGWQFHCPLPLRLFEDPLALVMTAVPGRPLSYFLRESDELSRETLAAIGRTVMAAMDRYWTVAGRIYGDVNFHNILCAPRTRSLSLVDPGMARVSWECKGVSSQWYPASRDAAYMLYSVACAVRTTLSNPAARSREKWLVRLMLRALLEPLTLDARVSLLDEIHACARLHVARISGSWSPVGMWRAVVRKAADHCIAEILESLRESSPAVRSVPSLPGQEAVP